MLRTENSGPHALRTASVEAVDHDDIQVGGSPGPGADADQVHGIHEKVRFVRSERMRGAHSHECGGTTRILWEQASQVPGGEDPERGSPGTGTCRLVHGVRTAR